MDVTETENLDPKNTQQVKGSFVKDVIKLVSGTTFAQALLVLSAPILARLFAPESFGTLAVFVSLSTIVTTISCLRYEVAIMLPEKDEEAVNVLGVSLLMVFIISALCVPLLFIGGNWITTILKAPALKNYLWLAPVSILAGGAFQALNYWNTRTKHFGRLSVMRMVASVVTLTLQLGAAFLGRTHAGGLIGATVAGSFAGTVVLTWLILRDDWGLIRKSLSWGKMVTLFKRYQKFPLYDSWAVLLNSISWQLPNFLLSYFFSQTIVGYYSLGDRILRVPMSIIGNSLGQVFYQRSAEAKVEGSLGKLVANVFEQLVIWGQFPLLLMMVVGKDVFAVVLGAKWAEAGVYTQILSWWMFFWFISSPMSNLFRLLEKQEFSLYINIAIFVTRFLSLGLGGYLGDPRLALMLFSGSGVLLYGYLSLAVVIYSGVEKKKVFNILMKSILIFLPFGVFFVLLKVFDVKSLWIVIMVALVLGGYYLYVLRKTIFEVKNPFKPARAN
jgi:O-antigen/teichoic acid export membrane protein